MRALSTIMLAALIAALAPVTSEAKKRGDPCSSRYTTSRSVNNCKPKNPPPVAVGADPDDFSGGQNGGKGGTNNGKGGGRGGGGRGGGGHGGGGGGGGHGGGRG